MGDNQEMAVIEAYGSHRQVGQQIGEQMRQQIGSALERLGDDLPAGVTLAELREKGRACLAVSEEVYPQYVDEIRGIAEGAGAAFDDVFLHWCEELWEAPAWKHKGCTDMAARGRATQNGHTLLAHTNDLPGLVENDLVIIKAQTGDEPPFLGVSVGGMGFSAGYNAAGIGLTGNQVDSNDLRTGVPRMLIVRRVLGSRRLGEALDACLLDRRASNYNNIIADANGEVYSMEGSATDCEPIYITGNIMAHANHYISPAMRQYEADRSAIGDSVFRYNRAYRLLRENYGELSPRRFQRLLADHANYPASICKHKGEVITVFSMIIDLEDRKTWIGRGRPCQAEYSEYQLQVWPKEI